MEDNLDKMTKYFIKCILDAPKKLNFSDESLEEVENLLSAITNSLCYSANSVGATKEILIRNVSYAWDAINNERIDN